MKNTLDILIQKYNSPTIDMETLQRDVFPHLSIDTLTRRARDNMLGLPIMRADMSQKSALWVHVEDLADYIDARRSVARKEFRALLTASSQPQSA